jgi:tetratricopeptide (TPR) repeat protein
VKRAVDVLAHVLLLVLGLSTSAHAQPAPEGPTLPQYFDALSHEHLLEKSGATIDQLRRSVERAERLYLDERYSDAAIRLSAVVESPRYADFADLPEFRSAEFLLAGSLGKVGSSLAARRVLNRILARGPQDIYFVPALRRRIDLAFETERLPEAREDLAAISGMRLSEDAQNEIRYLDGRIAYEAGRLDEAKARFSEITRRSRFYAGSLYFRGLVAVRSRDFRTAEADFCRIVDTPDDSTFSFYVDDRYFALKDLAHLALGRVAHEEERHDDAFYYYFQVPEDSPRLQEALFEAAWTLFSAGDYEAARDSVDQLETSFPGTPFRAEAELLRAFVDMQDCQFDRADRTLRAFLAAYEPVLREIDRILADPTLQADLYDRLLAREGRTDGAGGARTREPMAIILDHLRVDADFYRVHGWIRGLDRAAATGGRLRPELADLRARVAKRGEVRHVRVEEAPVEPREDLARRMDDSRRALARAEVDLRTMRTERGAPEDRIREEERRVQDLGRSLDAISRRLAAMPVAAPEPAPPGRGLDGLLAQDEARAATLPTRTAALRVRLVDAANRVALSGLGRLREKIIALIRRAELGRIDAVIGAKRRLELEIESLAAGRFPPELFARLQAEGLIGEDQEYWPYEGEYWPDEYEEDEE